jgi:hypothetical protein
MFAVRHEVLDALLADAEWGKRFDQAKTTGEIERVVSDFCRAKGIRIVEVKT